MGYIMKRFYCESRPAFGFILDSEGFILEIPTNHTNKGKYIEEYQVRCFNNGDVQVKTKIIKNSIRRISFGQRVANWLRLWLVKHSQGHPK